MGEQLRTASPHEAKLSTRLEVATSAAGKRSGQTDVPDGRALTVLNFANHRQQPYFHREMKYSTGWVTNDNELDHGGNVRHPFTVQSAQTYLTENQGRKKKTLASTEATGTWRTPPLLHRPVCILMCDSHHRVPIY